MSDENETVPAGQPAQEQPAASAGALNRWWPAIVVMAIFAVGVGGFAFGFYVGGDQQPEPDTMGARLEAFAGCLSDAGATVPEVAAAGDGGFTVTFPGDFFETFRPISLLPAVPACARFLPDVDLLRQFDLGELLRPRPEAGGQPDRAPDRDRDRRPEVDVGALERLCERLREAADDQRRELRPLLEICGLSD